ncbi:hypothetical protein BGX27_009967 [Mortierella sp. AM989]|nr:hypothetical protein BGX27_009967 [Mortierella sp. AM989]
MDKAEISESTVVDSNNNNLAPNHTSTTVTETVDMVDTTPTNNGPFGLNPEQCMQLIDPKSTDVLKSLGGIEGVIAALHTDPTKGLSTANRPLTTVVSDDEKENQAHNVDTSSSSVTIEDRVQYFGRNALPPRKPKSIFQLMWMALHDKILILLLIAAVVSIGLGFYEDYGVEHKKEDVYNEDFTISDKEQPKISWVEGIAILVAVMIVVLVGSINDFQKEAQFRKLNAKKEDREVKVLRNGETVLLSVFDVVVGDILHLEPGDVISADGIFLGGHNLKCDESAMTGESDAVKKVSFEEYKKLEEAEAALHKDEPTALTTEPHGLHGVDPFIISGSKVLEGVGLYVVTGVGPNSFHGKTMMSLRTEADETPLQSKLNGLAEQIAKLGGLAALLMLVILFIRYFVGFATNGKPPANEIFNRVVGIFIAAITVVVVAVPEGLPLAVTLALAFATTRMLKDNNLVRVLAACETMGNATTVCSDKTGTLTQNRMTIVSGTLGINTRFIADVPEGDLNQRANIPINKHAVAISQLVGNLPPAVTTLMHEAIAINSSAFESEDENGKLSFIGSKTEVAMLDFSKKIGGADYRKLREAVPVTHMYPFSSERKSMATIVQMGPKKFRLHAKGASEIIMKRCNKIIQISSAADQSTPLSEKDRNAEITELDLNSDLETQIHKTIISYATQSLRTIGVAYRDFESWPPAGIELNQDGEVPFSAVAESGLTLVGIVGIEDPLRDGVPEAVLACQRAGVFVRMVTGDNILTAKAIATQCGIYTQGGIIMEGPKFRALSEEEMDAVIPRLQVLARSSPDDKKILVGRLKAMGEIVAVTGDGTNDGPALKMSDVGFSMGIAGTEVAKEASSIILMDDNFSSIVKAILWGRSVNDAVKKFLQFQLTVNVTAVVLTLVTAAISDKQEPVMSAVQLLWVNLIMDTLAALALATDPPTPDLLDRQPEPRTAPLISFTMWKMILGQSILQLVVTFVLKYKGMDILGYYDLPSDLAARPDADLIRTPYITFKEQELNTMVFNTFVFLQIFNEINSRRLDNRLNVFSGILKNTYFMVIFVIMVVFQIIIVEFGDVAFKTEKLDAVQWIICVILGLLSLPVGVLIRLVPDEIFGVLRKWVDASEPPRASLPTFEGHPAQDGIDRTNSLTTSVNSRTNSRTNSMSSTNKVRSDLTVFKSIRGGRLSIDSERSERNLNTGAVTPSLVAVSIGTGILPNAKNSSQVDVSGSSRRSSRAATPQPSDLPVNTQREPTST